MRSSVFWILPAPVPGSRKRKGPLYARQGVRGYWIVNATARQLEVFGNPVAGAYTVVATLKPGTTVHLGALPAIASDRSVALA